MKNMFDFFIDHLDNTFICMVHSAHDGIVDDFECHILNPDGSKGQPEDPFDEEAMWDIVQEEYELYIEGRE